MRHVRGSLDHRTYTDPSRYPRLWVSTLAIIALLPGCAEPPPIGSHPTRAEVPARTALTDYDRDGGRDVARASEPAAEAGQAVDRDVARIRAATAPFRSADEARAAGYVRITDCVENPPHGAMGYHFQNEALLDDRIDLERPEILVYERLPDGEFRLTGVEYVVPFSAWPADRDPPMVMGQALKPAPGLAIWYLHVWVWQENPSGIFADWNPLVAC